MPAGPAVLAAVIFDVDGVLVASPHERAWREALDGIADPARFTTEFYQAYVAGKPRFDGARAALEQLSVPDAQARAQAYAERKQQILEALIATREFTVFPDALRLAQALLARGIPLAVASSSKNANQMMRLIQVAPDQTLLDLFKVNVCGRDFAHGKPDPEIFLTAAAELAVPPASCLVVEDAPAGIEAARAGGMMALGIARFGDAALLQAASADLVVTNLDQVDVDAVLDGRLAARGKTDTMDMQQALMPTEDRDWVLIEPGYDPLRESSIESRFTVSNGLLGVRGARAVSRRPSWLSWLPTLRWASWPRTYVAGLFETPNTEPSVPALVPAPDWLRLRILLDGTALVHRRDDTLHHQRMLDMQRGLMLTEWRQRDPSGVVVKVATLRLVSLADRALGLQLVRIEVEQGNAELTVDARFDNAGAGLDPVRLAQDCGVWRTEQSGKGLAIACNVALQLNGIEQLPRALAPFRWSWTCPVEPGRVLELQRLIAVARSDDAASVLGSLDRAKRIGWPGVLADHEAAWAERWRLSGVAITGDDTAVRALRFATYHLNSAVNPCDELVSVGARALTGDAYAGHVFWDTEIYLLPFYIATWPDAARALLMYRFHTLPGARAKAARAGWRGAMYAWESADTGEETTPEQVVGPHGEPIRVLCGEQEQHITADIAYAVWQYWEATGDEAFLLDAGAEVLLETARFWASRASLEADGKRHIRGVIGPDEYHEQIDDSAYTNVMARWNIRRGIDIAALLRERWPARWSQLAAQLQLTDMELRDWAAAADTLHTGFDPATGLFEQFAGFYALEAIDLAAYAERKVPLDVVLGRERTQRSQVVKQADVVALLALLPDECDAAARLANFRFYERRCGHGSSLSRGMHALAAARLGAIDLASRYFSETAAIDLADTADGSAGGVHIAALGGLWQAAILGFAGVSLRADALRLEPRLPPNWQALEFHVHWRGRLVGIKVAPAMLEAELLSGEAMPLRVGGQRHILAPGIAVRLSRCT
jgi:HAD superfamily hydrolase (TIGR01509 family)